MNTLLARHWWTLALAGRDPLPGYTFNGQGRDAETGDPTGVNLTAGEIPLGTTTVYLNGVPDAESFPSSLPARAFTYHRVTGPGKLAVPDGMQVQIRRVK